MSRIILRAIALTLVGAGFLLGVVGLDYAYDAMIGRDPAMLAFMLGLVTAPGFVLIVGGVQVWLDTEPAPAEPADEPADDGHTDGWHCWCPGCTEHRTGIRR